MATIPERATVLTGWTRHGIVYGTRDHGVWVWPPAEDGFGYGFNRWI